MRAGSIALILLCAAPLRASEEDNVRWRSARIDCFTDPMTGQVRISAKADARGLRSLVVTAFGKDFPVPRDEIAKLYGIPARPSSSPAPATPETDPGSTIDH
jgi:hypothetical protein